MQHQHTSSKTTDCVALAAAATHLPLLSCMTVLVLHCCAVLCEAIAKRWPSGEGLALSSPHPSGNDLGRWAHSRGDPAPEGRASKAVPRPQAARCPDRPGRCDKPCRCQLGLLWSQGNCSAASSGRQVSTHANRRHAAGPNTL